MPASLVTLRPQDVRALGILSEIARSAGCALVIIGAQVPWIVSTPGRELRVTRDVDAVVGTPSWWEFDRLGERLQGAGFVRRHAHRFVSPEGAEVDLLPFGEGVVENDRIVWPDGVVMSALGLAEAVEASVEREIAPGLRVRVATEPAFALLKIVAYTDRPYERGRDLADLVEAGEHYEEDGVRRFDLVDVQVDGRQAEFHEIGAYLLGVDVAAISRPKSRAAVEGFLGRLTDEYAEPISQILTVERRVSSETRRGDVWRALRAFKAGFERR